MDLNLGKVFSQSQLKSALANTYSIDYEQFRDTVVSFLGARDQQRYESKTMWDQIQWVVVSLIEQALTDDR